MVGYLGEHTLLVPWGQYPCVGQGGHLSLKGKKLRPRFVSSVDVVCHLFVCVVNNDLLPKKMRFDSFEHRGSRHIPKGQQR